jgi:hypothetical protein
MRRLTLNRELDEKFWAFHAMNEHVFELYKRLAYRMLSAGKTEGSSEQIFQVLRWELDLETFDEESEYKLSNIHRKRYAILLGAIDHRFRTFFTFKPRVNWKDIDDQIAESKK